MIEVALVTRRAEPRVGLHEPELPEDRTDCPQPVERVPQAEVRERRVATTDEVVVVVQKLLLQAIDVLEALRGEVVVVQRLDEARRERVDGHRSVLKPPREERVDEPVRVQHQAVALADAGGRRELHAVGFDPFTHRHGVPELCPDAREPREELVEFLLRGDVRFRVDTRVELQTDAHQVVGRARVVVKRNHPEPAAREHVVQGPLVPAPALPLGLEDIVEWLDPEHVCVEAT